MLGIFTVGVVAAEIVLVQMSFVAGLGFHALLVFSALTYYSMASHRVRIGRSAGLSPGSRELACVSFVPLIRVLSAGAALKGIPSVFLTGVAVVPVIMAAVLAARAFRPEHRKPGSRLSARALPVQFLIGLSGVALGLAGFFAVRPDVVQGAVGNVALSFAVAIMALAGVAEELIFRGVVQSALEKLAGVAAVGWSSLLFATLYIGSQPFLLLPFMAAAGLYFGLCARSTGSVLGVCIAHALMNAMFVLVAVVI